MNNFIKRRKLSEEKRTEQITIKDIRKIHPETKDKKEKIMKKGNFILENEKNS